MLRWETVEEKELYGLTVRLYRDPFVARDTVQAGLKNLELDHYAYKFLGSELYTYKILNTNFTKFIEERGDVDRLGDLGIPVEADSRTTF
ncbi:MAG: hypothetical protein GY853_01890 [PVC group bacterium]|nr:hypothetical protein [PVC group bacterium]